MNAPAPTPATTLVILLGASRFPELGVDTGDPETDTLAEITFSETAKEVDDYFTSPTGFNLPETNLCRLFDSEKGPDPQDAQITEFLAGRIGAGAHAGTPPTDLIIYYIGHGMPDEGRMYCLALRKSRSSNVGISSIRVVDLATTLAGAAAKMRVYLVLDACYAANAARAFSQHRSPIDALRYQIDHSENLPPCGVSLLCSSASTSVSHLVLHRKRTMFSESLLEVLWHGYGKEEVNSLSLAEVHFATVETIRQKNPGTAVRPEIHSPQQPVGDISRIPLFPNNVGPVREARDREREERAREQEARFIAEQEERVRREECERKERDRAQKREQEERARREQEAEDRRRAQDEKVRLEDLEAEGVHDRPLDTNLLREWIKRKPPATPDKTTRRVPLDVSGGRITDDACPEITKPEILKQILARLGTARDQGHPLSFLSAANAHCRECRLRAEKEAKRKLIEKRREAVIVAALQCATLVVLTVYFVAYIRFWLALGHKDFDGTGPPIASLWLTRAHVAYVTTLNALIGIGWCVMGLWMLFRVVSGEEKEEGVGFIFGLVMTSLGGLYLYGAGYWLWQWGWVTAVQGAATAKPTDFVFIMTLLPILLALAGPFISAYGIFQAIKEACVPFKKEQK